MKLLLFRTRSFNGKVLSLLLLLLLFLSLHLAVQAQPSNHVSNGSFEFYNTCPTNQSNIADATGWQAYGGTADYCHGCSSVMNVPNTLVGFQNAADGNGFAGQYSFTSSIPPLNSNNTREYTTRPITPLAIGKAYEVSLSISLSDTSRYGTNGWGIHFYDNLPSHTTGAPIVLTPKADFSGYGIITDKTNWVRLVDTFIADSAYDNIVIGNFKSNSSLGISNTSSGQHLSYYFFDSVVVRELKKFKIHPFDTFACLPSTLSVGYTVYDPSYFNAGNVFSLQLSDASGSFASPTVLGSVTATTSGTITGTIPTTVSSGTHYRLRIVSSSTADSTLDNGRDIALLHIPQVTGSSNGSICENTTLTLSASSTSNRIAGYTWQGPGSYTSTVQNPTRATALPSMSGDYIVTITDSIGCSGKDTVSVLVKPLPAVPTAGANSPVCPNTPLNLTATSVTSGTSFHWTGPNGFSSFAQNPQVSANATYGMAGTYSVTSILNGCSSASAGSTVVAVQITTPTPVASANLPVCYTTSLNLSASSISNASYNWTGPNGFTSNSQNPTVPYLQPVHAGSYIVTATVNGCVSLPDTIDVPIKHVQIGAYVSPGDTICQGFTASFVAFPQNPGIIPYYQWYKNHIPVPGANALVFATSSLATGDKIYCSMTANGVCPVPMTVTTDTFEMVVLPIVTKPEVTISADPGLNLRPSDNVKFIANVKHGGTTPKFQWFKNGTILPGAKYATLQTTGLSYMDMIHVDVVSEDPCAQNKNTADTVWIQFPTSIHYVSTRSISMHPNPNHGSFSLSGIPEAEARLQIINEMGQILYDKTQPAVNGKIRFDQNLPIGHYLLRLITKDNSELLRFTVEAN